MALTGRVGVNLWTVFGWEPRRLVLDESLFARMAAAGASGVELVLDDRELTVERLLSGNRELSSLLATHDLAVTSIASRQLLAHNPASRSPDVRGRALRVIRDTCRVAREYGAEIAVVVPGVQERRVAYEATYDAALQTLELAGRYAQEEGVTLAVENVPLGFLQSPLEFRQLLDDAGMSCVRACVDLGNVVAAHQAFPENWALALADRIALVHATDFGAGPGGQRTRLLGTGAVPWRECLEALIEIDYEGDLVIETPPDDRPTVERTTGLAAMEASVRFLRDALEHAGVGERPRG